MTQTDWSFARRPVWLLGHLVALVAVIAFVSAGLWQLDRRDQRDELNSEIEARLAMGVTDFVDIDQEPPEEIRFREVRVAGRFDPAGEVMLVLQSLDGVSGHRVLTPLIVEGRPYDAVLVDRGWVPIDLDQPGDAAFAAPGSLVEVTGYVRVSQTKGRAVPETGVIAQIGRVDVERIDQQLPYDLAPVFIHTVRVDTPVDPPVIDLPRRAPFPALDPGSPHLSYAIQWFIFATVVVVGYVVLMRRTSRTDTSDN